jgi:hypothetical protein
MTASPPAPPESIMVADGLANIVKGVSWPKILELSSCQYIGQAEDVILAEPIGTVATVSCLAAERPEGVLIERSRII